MEEQEEWKPVVGYENNYEVSNWGRVKSQSRRGAKGGILKPRPNGDYLQVCLYKNGKKETRLVHIIVMRAFMGECPKNHEVDHYDWNPKNNRLDNLSYQPKELNRGRHSPEWLVKMQKLSQDPEWKMKQAEGCRKCSQDPEWLKNTAEAAKKRAQDPEWLKKNAEGAKKRAKPVDQYTLDGTFVKRWPSVADAARELGLSKGNISKCCKGKYKSTGGFIWKFAEPC